MGAIGNSVSSLGPITVQNENDRILSSTGNANTNQNNNTAITEKITGQNNNASTTDVYKKKSNKDRTYHKDHSAIMQSKYLYIFFFNYFVNRLRVIHNTNFIKMGALTYAGKLILSERINFFRHFFSNHFKKK